MKVEKRTGDVSDVVVEVSGFPAAVLVLNVDVFEHVAAADLIFVLTSSSLSLQLLKLLVLTSSV